MSGTPNALLSFALEASDLRRMLRRVARKHPAVRGALTHYGFPAERRHPCGFQTLARALAGQQLSVKAAATIYGRLEAHFGDGFEPGRVSRARVTTLRRLGLSERKAQSLRELAKAAHTGRLQLDEFDHLADSEVETQIVAIKGFGVWSAQMYLIFSLGRPDVWPIDDLGVREGLREILGREQALTPKQTAAFGVNFSPYRSSVALLCWHVRNSARSPMTGV